MAEAPKETGTPKVFERWLDALLPDPVELGGIHLRPMSYGHAILLARLTGWEPFVSGFRLDDLPVALYVLSRDWREAATGIVRPEAHEFLEGLAKRTSLPECAQVWTRYLSNALVLPRFRKLSMGASKVSSRPPGAPLLLRLRLFALRNLGLGPEELEDFILADLVWLWLAHIEEEGGLRLHDDDDDDFEAWCQEEEKRMAASTETPSSQEVTS